MTTMASDQNDQILKTGNHKELVQYQRVFVLRFLSGEKVEVKFKKNEKIQKDFKQYVIDAPQTNQAMKLHHPDEFYLKGDVILFNPSCTVSIHVFAECKKRSVEVELVTDVHYSKDKNLLTKPPSYGFWYETIKRDVGWTDGDMPVNINGKVDDNFRENNANFCANSFFDTDNYGNKTLKPNLEFSVHFNK